MILRYENELFHSIFISNRLSHDQARILQDVSEQLLIFEIHRHLEFGRSRNNKSPKSNNIIKHT